MHLMCVYVHMCMPTCVMGVEAKGQHCVLSSGILHIRFRDRVSHWAWGSQVKLGCPFRRFQGSPCLYLLNTEIMDPTPLFPTFYVGARDPNSGLQACVASLTEPSSHPKKSFYRCYVTMAVDWALG